MYQLFWAKIQAGLSIISMIVAWVIGQVPNFDFTGDEITTIIILMIAIGTIWRAFLAKDKSETQILKEQIKQQEETIEALNRAVNQLEDHVDTLKNGH